MNYSERALTLLTEPSEGLRLKAYPDPGTGGAPWGIGFGHTSGVKEGDTCTMEQALKWLQQDVIEAEDIILTYVKPELTQNQFDALVDFILNVKKKEFFTSTLLRKLNARDFAGANAEFKRWIYAGGHILPGLVKRRQAEANWFMNGTV